MADAIKDVSGRSGLILDCFGGSGSTLIAAHKTGRRARVIELDPIYVDRSVRRWQAYAKDDAILAGTEKTFEQIADERTREKGEPKDVEAHGEATRRRVRGRVRQAPDRESVQARPVRESDRGSKRHPKRKGFA